MFMACHALLTRPDHPLSIPSDAPPALAEVLGPDLPEDHPSRKAWKALFNAFVEDTDLLSPGVFRAARAATMLLLCGKLEARLLHDLDNPEHALPPAAVIARILQMERELEELLESLVKTPAADPGSPGPRDPEVHTVPGEPRSRPCDSTDPDVPSRTEPRNPGSEPPTVRESSSRPVSCFDEPADETCASPEYLLRVARAEKEASLWPMNLRPTAKDLVREAVLHVSRYDALPRDTSPG